MTKMAAMPIYGIFTLKIILFPETSGSISMELGMKHQSFKGIGLQRLSLSLENGSRRY